MARARQDYISLDVKHPSTFSDTQEDSEEDPERGPDDHEKRIPFAPKPQTLKQRIAEETSTYLIYLQYMTIEACLLEYNITVKLP